ncbi:hypothetical protein ACET3Z_029912 [Daucus carota]
MLVIEDYCGNGDSVLHISGDLAGVLFSWVQFYCSLIGQWMPWHEFNGFGSLHFQNSWIQFCKLVISDQKLRSSISGNLYSYLDYFRVGHGGLCILHVNNVGNERKEDLVCGG